MNVNKLYLTGSYTMEEACKKIGICKKTYYNIKKKINNNEQNKKVPEVEAKVNQIGGNKNKSNININEYKNTDDFFRGSYDEIQKRIKDLANF